MSENTALALIRKEFSVKENVRQISLLLGDDLEKAKRYISDLLNVIAMDTKPGKDGKTLSNCTFASIMQCAKNAISLDLPIDGRQLVYVTRYGTVASLSPGYKGYIHKIKKYNSTVDIQVGIVFKGDTFNLKRDTGTAEFTHISVDPFNCDYDDVIGGYCYMSYSIDGRNLSTVEPVGREDLDIIRAKAKTDNVWNEFTGEQMKKAIIRRASKIPFASAVHELDLMDNKEYNMDKTDDQEKPAAADKWNSKLDEEEAFNNATDVTPETEETEPAEDVKPEAETVKPEEESVNSEEIPVEGSTQQGESSEEPGVSLPTEGLGVSIDSIYTYYDTLEEAVTFLKTQIEKKKNMLTRKALLEENVELGNLMVEAGGHKQLQELHDIMEQGE